MYEFRDVFRNYDYEPNTEIGQSDSIYIYELDKSFPQLFPHLRVLSASGRESSKFKLNTAERTSADGSIYLGRKHESKTIVLNCVLNATDNTDFINHIEAIHNHLQLKEIKFSFLDEKDKGIFRFGTVSNIEVQEGTLTPTIQISIFCSDPFKYKEWPWNGGNIPLREENKYSAWFELGIKENNGLYQPKKIVVEYPLDSSVVSEGVLIEACDESGKVIKSIKSLPYSEWRQQNKMEIYFKSDNGVYMFINGYANNSYLDISSNIADFGVPKNGFIRIKNTDITQAYAYSLIKNL